MRWRAAQHTKATGVVNDPGFARAWSEPLSRTDRDLNLTLTAKDNKARSQNQAPSETYFLNEESRPGSETTKPRQRPNPPHCTAKLGYFPSIMADPQIDGRLRVAANPLDRRHQFARFLAVRRTRSSAPWNAQTGAPLSRSAGAGSPPPKIGAIASNRLGWAAARAQVP